MPKLRKMTKESQNRNLKIFQIRFKKQDDNSTRKKHKYGNTNNNKKSSGKPFKKRYFKFQINDALRRTYTCSKK